MTEIELLLEGITQAVTELHFRLGNAGHRIFGIVNIDMQSMRLYRVRFESVKEAKSNFFTGKGFPQANYVALKPIVTGSIVQIQLGYAVPDSSIAGGKIVDALSYGMHESSLAHQHIVDYLVNGAIPVADEILNEA